ncbi:Alpha/Beta hydrolase protein [Irpex rosettiformis]|uniref:Alpha/Beta hydrolase protein n=1 Tax=Irpex rosettiformis TaxID=378272 RepID=A0ACB8TMY6_9APHY|nr:Alpha/Beta hydrolase protein [Irpex rosettiformis]
MWCRPLLTLAVSLTAVRAQLVGSFPHAYPGQPTGDFSPAWQDYFQVKDSLPNVSFPLGRNWAGNIPVGRPNQPNDTLFFWGFEKENGSFTANSTEPWGIWLNGGPGSSSMLGLFFENGPLHVADDFSLFSNNQSWDKLADYIWIDQPVGVGFGTVQKGGFVPDEDQMGIDFFGFLENLVKVFPNLKTRPLHLTGESYAGTYIPYITKTYFGLSNPPVNLTKIAIGDGTLGSGVVFEILPTLTVIETFPELIGYDPEVYEYFRTQHHLCGFDLNLTYPQQGGKFPTLELKVQPSFISSSSSSGRFVSNAAHRQLKTNVVNEGLKAGLFPRLEQLGVGKRSEVDRRRIEKRDVWKRDLTGRANGTIDPWYGCDLYDEMIDYALNFSVPWKGNNFNGFDVYNVPDALDPEAPMDASVFLNDNRTRTAIHAPTSKNWQSSINYNFSGPHGGDPSLEPMVFLDDLATNATERGVGVVIYSGNFDSLVAHIGSQVVIQNTTFGGIQGFSRPPSTPWFDDNGAFAGIVHQERNWTYVLVQGAGHLVPQQQPEKAFVFLREFVLGSNTTGLVTNSSGTLTVTGGENATLADTVLPGQDEIYVGSGTTQSTYVYPSASIAAWNSFFATARGNATAGVVTATPPAQGSAGVRVWVAGAGAGGGLVVCLVAAVAMMW